MHKRYVLSVFIFILVLWGGYWAISYFAIGKRAIEPGAFSQDSANAVGLSIEEVASGLEVPWSLAWTSPGRMLLTERPGRVRIVENDVLRETPLIVFDHISSEAEEGLMGLAIDPDYATNRYIYVCYAYPNGDRLYDRVVRLKDEGMFARVDRTIIEGIPAAPYHAGCQLSFGPDTKLYITTGDATQRTLAQDIESLAGKILRINDDGTIPADNPFVNSPIWSYGHRNPQGIAWHPQTGELYETEHGPSISDGPAGGDEVNRIVRGGNYGWPLVSHEERLEGTLAPLLTFTPAEAPASGAFYTSDEIPQFKNSFFFGALRGEGLIRILFDPDDPNVVLNYEKIADVNVGRVRAVAEGPDGYLYFSTSNRDGRGEAVLSDDRIFRIRPK